MHVRLSTNAVHECIIIRMLLTVTRRLMMVISEVSKGNCVRYLTVRLPAHYSIELVLLCFIWQCDVHVSCRVAGLAGRVRKNKKRRPDRWLRWRTPFWVRSWTNKPEQDVGVHVLVYQKLSINPQLNLSVKKWPIQ